MVTTFPQARNAALKLGLQSIAIGTAVGLGGSGMVVAGAKLKHTVSKDEFLPQALRKKDKPDVHFGMYKKRLQEAERRKDRVYADPDATAAHKKEALEHYEETAKLAKNAAGVAKTTEKVVKGGSALLGGVAGAAATTLSLGTVDPAIVSEATKHAVTTGFGIGGSALSAAYGKDARKTIADHVADRSDKKNGVHYPSRTAKGVLGELAIGKINLEQGDHFYDHKGRKWEFNAPPEEVTKLQDLAKTYQRERVNHEKALRELKAGTSFFRKNNNLTYEELNARNEMAYARDMMRGQILSIQSRYMEAPKGYIDHDDEVESIERGW